MCIYIISKYSHIFPIMRPRNDWIESYTRVLLGGNCSIFTETRSNNGQHWVARTGAFLNHLPNEEIGP